MAGRAVPGGVQEEGGGCAGGPCQAAASPWSLASKERLGEFTGVILELGAGGTSALPVEERDRKGKASEPTRNNPHQLSLVLKETENWGREDAAR